jgi:drug/metabolite transporter (DMT)-like permease
MFVEVVSYAYGGYLSKRLLSKGYPIELVNGVSLSIGGLALLFLRICTLPFQPVLVASWPAALGYAAALALISDVAGYSIYGYLITRRYTITFLNFSGFLCPIFGALFSKLIFNEVLYLNYAIAFVLTLSGLFLFYKDELAQG